MRRTRGSPRHRGRRWLHRLGDGRSVARRSRGVRHRRPAGDRSGPGRGPPHRGPRRSGGRRRLPHQRSAHLRGGRHGREDRRDRRHPRARAAGQRGQPPGPPGRRRHLRPAGGVRRHAGHRHPARVRAHGGGHRLERASGPRGGSRSRSRPHPPGLARWVLPGGADDGAKAGVRPTHRRHPRRSGCGCRRGRQAHRCDRHRDACRAACPCPRRPRAGVRAAVRIGQGPGEPARLRGRTPARRHRSCDPVARSRGRGRGRRRARRRPHARRVRRGAHPGCVQRPGRRPSPARRRNRSRAGRRVLRGGPASPVAAMYLAGLGRDTVNLDGAGARGVEALPVRRTPTAPPPEARSGSAGERNRPPGP